MIDDLVEFREDGHIYRNTRTKVRYKSVTTFLDQFKPDFDSEYWSIYKAIEFLCGGKESEKFKTFKRMLSKYGKDFLYSYIKQNYHFTEQMIRFEQRRILAEWDVLKKEGLTKGSKWHKQQEYKDHFNEKTFMQGVDVALSKDHEFTYDSNGMKMLNKRLKLSKDLQDGAYIELLLHNHEIQMAGQTDKARIETIGNIRYVDICDWKTNKRLTLRNEYSFLKEPVSHVEYTDFFFYALQLSFYAYMFSMYGYKVRNLTLCHVGGTIRQYEIPYLEKEVKKLVEYRKKELSLA